ncbi:Carboxypeptidase [Citrus sinensis]|nr:Carboxypeptidase [Citrus sinensis]
MEPKKELRFMFGVGNALTDDYHDYLGLFQFWWSAGLISDDTYKQLNLLCDYESFVHPSSSCDNIFTPSCTASVSQSNRLLKRMLVVGHASEKYDPCTKKHSVVYFNQPEVQKALHVIPVVAPEKWETCSGVVNNNWLDSPRTVLDIYHELIHSGLRIWMFRFSQFPNLHLRLCFLISNLFLHMMGGWTQEYAGLTFVTVRGAGHEVPLQRPKPALTLIKSFLSGRSMPCLERVSLSDS